MGQGSVTLTAQGRVTMLYVSYCVCNCGGQRLHNTLGHCNITVYGTGLCNTDSTGQGNSALCVCLCTCVGQGLCNADEMGQGSSALGRAGFSNTDGMGQGNRAL